MAMTAAAISTGCAGGVAWVIAALLIENIHGALASLGTFFVQTLVLFPLGLALIARLRTATVAHFAPADLFLSLLLDLLLSLAVLVFLTVAIAIRGTPARARHRIVNVQEAVSKLEWTFLDDVGWFGGRVPVRHRNDRIWALDLSSCWLRLIRNDVTETGRRSTGLPTGLTLRDELSQIR